MVPRIFHVEYRKPRVAMAAPYIGNSRAVCFRFRFRRKKKLLGLPDPSPYKKVWLGTCL